MLIQMPRGSSDPSGSQNAEVGDAFEAALRRDLASAPVVSYDATLGGWPKRAIDLSLTLMLAPLWLPALLGAALWAKMRHPAPVFQSDERIGYGGRVFRCFKLRIAPPMATIQRLRTQEGGEAAPANDLSVIVQQADSRRAKWRRAFERLPRLFNVIRGELALVGPTPLSREALEPLKTAKRYYLSARPGVVGVSSVADANEEEASQYKMYAFSWSLTTDALILWDALRSLRDRGELWRPTRIRKPRPAAQASGELPVRRRTSSGAA
jgi:exopolysaccharide production protein ExoY